MKNNKEEFTYCIGYEYPSGRIGIYTYGTNICYGTMKDAIKSKEFAEKMNNNDRKYFIYKLVKIN